MHPLFPEGILTTNTSPADDHLAYAIELCVASLSSRPDANSPAPIGHRRIVRSSIMHAVSALDAYLNKFQYETFIDESSPHYLPVSRRNTVLRRFLDGWRNATIPDRLAVLAELTGQGPIRDNLLARCREVGLRRNVIVHGVVYQTTVLMSPSEAQPTTFDLIDIEESMNCRTRFPHLKLGSMLELQTTQAEAAIDVTFESLQSIASPYMRRLSLFFTEPTRTVVLLEPPSFTREQAAKQLLEAAQARKA